MECSNKGFCNRRTGVCECFEGYRGSACNLMACPSAYGEECSGHGICATAREIAEKDDNNVYELWDKDASQGCICDPGYTGPICEQRVCKVGYDPIYVDPDGSRRYSNWSFVISTESPSAVIIGNYSMIFYDYSGEDWMTRPINYGAYCHDITQALESIPNSVIAHGSVRCLQWRDYNKISPVDEPALLGANPFYGIKTTLAFPRNPGILRQPKISIFLDGKRPTLYSTDSVAPVRSFVYPDGFTGEEFEYFSERCVDVDVSIATYVEADGSIAYQYFSDLTPLEFRLLAQCLGDADGVDGTPASELGSGRVRGIDFSWDFGTIYNPHLVRLVDLTASDLIVTDMCNGTMNSVRGGGVTCSLFPTTSLSVARPPGFFVPLFFDPSDNRFKIFTRPGQDYHSSTTFAVFTTRGTVQMVSDFVNVITDPQQLYSQSLFTVPLNSSADLSYFGNIDCETNQPNTNGALDCIEKGDRLFILDPHLNVHAMGANPKYLNIYTVESVVVLPYARLFSSVDSVSKVESRNRITLDMSVNAAFPAGSSVLGARAYIFRPPIVPVGGFRYVSTCSNRGMCDAESGQCECFSGFYGDDCSLQHNVVQ